MATSTIKMPDTNKNKLNNAVNITSYTSTDYVFPSDGYLVLNATSTTTTFIRGRIEAANDISFTFSCSYHLGNSSNALYVKKGMEYRTMQNENNGVAAFYALA